jgi:hypothetical protein
MSWAVVAWAQKQKTGSPSSKAVLLALASFANDDGGSCFPGQDAIHDITELSLDTIQRQLSALVAAGFVSRKKREAQKGQWASWEYQILVSNPDDRAAPCGTVNTVDQAAPCGPVDAVDQAAPRGSVKVHRAAPCGSTRPHGAASPGRTMRLDPFNKPFTEPSRARGPASDSALGPLGAALSKRLGPDKYWSWFGHAKLGPLTVDAVTIEMPSHFIRDHVAQNFEHDILLCCQAQQPTVERVQFVVVAR